MYYVWCMMHDAWCMIHNTYTHYMMEWFPSLGCFQLIIHASTWVTVVNRSILVLLARMYLICIIVLRTLVQYKQSSDCSCILLDIRIGVLLLLHSVERFLYSSAYEHICITVPTQLDAPYLQLIYVAHSISKYCLGSNSKTHWMPLKPRFVDHVPHRQNKEISVVSCKGG
jgi:hypothetical protein